MPSWKTIWDYLKKHPIWVSMGVFWLILLIFVPFFGLNSSADRITFLNLWVSLLSLGVYAWTLWVLIDTFRLQQVANQLQSNSAERTARMEMAKVVTEAFSHSEMFEAIDYFKKVSPHLVDENGRDRKEYIELIQNAPETERHRYFILTTLRHAQRLYDKEKPDTDLFTSLITPDIVEVTLCLYKLNDYIKDFNEPVYEMVYKAFEYIRRSYLAPYWDSIDNKNEIAHKRLPQTRRILTSLQTWDRQWGDDGDRILTEKDLVLLDYLEGRSPQERLNTLIERFEAYKKQVKLIKKPEAFAELYFFRGVTK